MLLTSPLLNLPPPLKLKLNLHSPFLNASFTPSLPKLFTSSSSPPPSSSSPSSLTILAMKRLQGRVVKNANDKTVAVEVVRLAPHPKYKRRVRIKKRYQAHDPENVFQVGDFVQLEKVRPISKTKTFLAIPVVGKNVPKPVEAAPKELLELTLQSQEEPQQ